MRKWTDPSDNCQKIETQILIDRIKRLKASTMDFDYDYLWQAIGGCEGFGESLLLWREKVGLERKWEIFWEAKMSFGRISSLEPPWSCSFGLILGCLIMLWYLDQLMFTSVLDRCDKNMVVRWLITSLSGKLKTLPHQPWHMTDVERVTWNI